MGRPSANPSATQRFTPACDENDTAIKARGNAPLTDWNARLKLALSE
jgi:hypothetical protein